MPHLFLSFTSMSRYKTKPKTGNWFADSFNTASLHLGVLFQIYGFLPTQRINLFWNVCLLVSLSILGDLICVCLLVCLSILKGLKLVCCLSAACLLLVCCLSAACLLLVSLETFWLFSCLLVVCVIVYSLSVCLFVCMSVCLSVCLFVCLLSLA